MDNKDSDLTFSEKFRNKLNIFRENNPSAFIFVMLILTNVGAVVLSSLLLIFLPENKGRDFLEMMRFAFTLMVNPSGRYQYSDFPISLIITTFVVLLGMISLTGGTVGYITSIIMGIVKKSSGSRKMLHLKKHIVIINYNHKVPALIYDYCFDDISSTYVVILSDKDKCYIEKQIDDFFSIYGKKKKMFSIIVRKGNPLSNLELDKISLNTAKTVLLMSPEDDSYYDRFDSKNNLSFAISKLFMFITSYIEKNSLSCAPDLIVETPNSDVEKMVAQYHLGENSPKRVNYDVEPVNYNELLGKIFAIVSIMPSLNDVILHLVSFEGVEFYLEDIPEGVSISDDIARQNSAMPILDLGDKRVYLSEDEHELTNIKSNIQKCLKPLPEKAFVPYIQNEKSKIVIVGSNSKLPYILESLVCFKNEFKDYNFDVILMDTEDNKEKLDQHCSDPELSVLFKDPEHAAVVIKDIFDPLNDLDDSILDDANSVLFLSDEKCADGHIDEKPLLFWSRLNSAKARKQYAENSDEENITETQSWECLVEVLDMQNKDIIESRNRDQVILSEKFLSCLYAQLGKDPDRLEFVKDMVTFENDHTSVNRKKELVNECSIVCVRSDMFFKKYNGTLDFRTKRELITWVYEATGHKYLPLGCVKNKIHYLFARTNGKNDDLDTAVLLPKCDDEDLIISEEKIVLNPNDEIIVMKLERA